MAVEKWNCGGDVSDDSDEVPYSELSEEAERKAARAVGSKYGDEDSEGMRDDLSELADRRYIEACAEDGWSDDRYSDQGYPDLDSMDDDLASELGGEQTGAMLTPGRTTCARMHCCLWASAQHV